MILRTVLAYLAALIAVWFILGVIGGYVILWVAGAGG